MKNILYIVPSNYEDLLKKGVTSICKERDENGFFDNVLTLHPFTRDDKKIELNEKNHLFEYGWKFKQDSFNKYLLTKIIGTFIILFKLLFIFPFIIKKYKINVIRTTDPYYMGALGVFYSKLFRIPLFVSIHSDYDKRYVLDGPKGSFTILNSRKLAKYLEKFVYVMADKIIPIREYMKRNIISEFNIDAKKVDVFPHGISFNEFDNVEYKDIKKRFNINENKNIISFVGRISKENYVYDLIAVAKSLSQKRDDFIILVVGNGTEFENLQYKIQELELSNYINLVGFQDKCMVSNVRKQSEISLCFMAGYSLIEAAAARKPVIAYDVEWHYELVQDDKTGYLVRENDVNAVVDKANYLLDNKSLIKEFGNNIRSVAYAHHEISNTIRIKQDIYKENGL